MSDRAAVMVWRAGLAVVLLGGWQLAVALGAVDPFFFSRPSDIAQRIWIWVSEGMLWRHLNVTLEESALGLIIGGAIGVTAGFVLARSAFAARVLEPYIMMLNAVPRVVLAPVFLLWFGLGIWSKVALAVTLVFFIMFFSTYQGVREASRVIIDNVRMLGATERQLVRHVLIPSALSWIFSSLQVSLGFAMVGAVVGEYLGATRGLGYVIAQAEGTFDTTGVFAGMFVLSIVVVSASACVSRLERWLLRWKGTAMLAACASALIFFTAACGSGDQARRGPIRIAIGGQTQLVYLPTTLAQELGFYKEEGLDVELQDLEGGAKALQALVGGSADVVSGFYDHTIQMAAEGRELVAFVTMLRYPGLVLVSSPQSAREVTSVGSLKGRIAGVTTPGSSTHMFLTFMLVRHEVPVESVSVTAIGGGATAVAGIESGRIDVAWLSDPAFTLVKKRNPGIRILADLRSEEGTKSAFGVSTYPSAVLYSRADWLRTNRDSAARLARAIVKTLDWMKSHSEQEIAGKTPKALRGADDAAFVEALKASRAIFSTDGMMTADGAAAVRNVLDVSMPKVREATIDLSKTYTNEFAGVR